MRRFFVLLSFLFVTHIAAAEKPNVVFILVDDLRYDALGFIDPKVATPSIDALAREGTYLPNAVVTTSLCSPSRATILTGLRSRTHGVVDNNGADEEQLIFFPSYLQDAGYETAYVGKWHMGRNSDEPRPGFDHWVSFKGQGFYYPTDRIPAELVKKGVRHQLNVNGDSVDQKGYITDELTDYAIDWLEEGWNPTSPFFLYLSHKAVHADFLPAPRHRDMYKADDIVLPDPDIETKGAGKPMWVHNQRNSWHGVDFPYHSELSLAEYVARYYATLAAVDESVGRLVTWLEGADQLDNTIIIFMSDNGFMFGEHGLIDKRAAYEPSVKVPLVVYAPGRVPGGTIVDNRVRNLDIAPTILDFAGVEPPDSFEGVSVVPLLTGSEQGSEVPPFFYEYYWEWVFPQTPTTFAVTKDEIKYIQYHGLWDLEELYDLTKDPTETNNLVLDPNYHAELVERRALLFKELSGGQRRANVLFTERRAQGIRYRDKNKSKHAQYPESFLKEPGQGNLFEGFMPETEASP